MTAPHDADVVGLTAIAGGVVLSVKVVPRARQSAFDGVHGGELRVRLKAAPVDGAANAALLDLVADALDVARSTVRLHAGAQSRHKRVLVNGLDLPEVRMRLRKRLDGAGR